MEELDIILCQFLNVLNNSYGSNLMASIHQFKTLPNSLASAPRIFTKVTKPMLSDLRKHGHKIVSYIDDSFIRQVL